MDVLEATESAGAFVTVEREINLKKAVSIRRSLPPQPGDRFVSVPSTFFFRSTNYFTRHFFGICILVCFNFWLYKSKKETGI
jgi:hypothetical protein